MPFFQVLPYAGTDERGTAQAPAYQYPEADFTFIPPDQVDADVMDLHGSPVIFRPGYGDLELARQERKFRMERRPLAYDLAIRTGVFQLIPGNTGKVVGSDIAYAVSAGLYCVHLYACKVGQYIRHGFQAGPVELDILPGAEMTVALVVFLRNMRQHAQLGGRQQSIGDRHAQHRRMSLDVQSVHQTQRPVLILAEFAGQVAACLVAKLGYPFIYYLLIVLIVLVHNY